MKRPFFAVLGGMGTLATESYVRLLNHETRAHSDQEYLDYVIFNDASVPDRTAYLLDQSKENPFPVIADDIAKATTMGASFIVLTCNTAHYFFDDLQRLTPVPILHMPRVAAQAMSELFPASDNPRVGLMATQGSWISGVYEREIIRNHYQPVRPDDGLQVRIDSLIYDDVKGGGGLDRSRYRETIDLLLDPSGPYRCNVVMLGCTELSVLNETFPMPDLPLIDAQAMMVADTIRRARDLRNCET